MKNGGRACKGALEVAGGMEEGGKQGNFLDLCQLFPGLKKLGIRGIQDTRQFAFG